MKFEIKNLQSNINIIMRQIGYQPAYFQEPGEFSVVKKIMGSDYPRFHLYIKNTGSDFSFNLHLDQKKPSYEGSTAHGGDYESEAVRDEVERIKEIIHRT